MRKPLLDKGPPSGESLSDMFGRDGVKVVRFYFLCSHIEYPKRSIQYSHMQVVSWHGIWSRLNMTVLVQYWH